MKINIHDSELFKIVEEACQGLELDSLTISAFNFENWNINGHELTATAFYYKEEIIIHPERIKNVEKAVNVAAPSKKGVINHEIAHFIDEKHQISQRDDIKKLFKGFKSSENLRKLSSYAATNIKEFVAEGWSEYKSSDSPRWYAKRIGRIIEKAIG